MGFGVVLCYNIPILIKRRERSMYYSLNNYCREHFGRKLYKISLDGGFTCPNRDGKLGTRGCIFCSEGGSGDFAEKAGDDIRDQIEHGKLQVARKMPVSGAPSTGNEHDQKGISNPGSYIAYFQAYTNTYGPIERMEKIFTEAIMHEDIAVLSIATRPDCLPDEVLDLLERLNRIKPVWVELGLQTIHEKSARYIRRGYSLDVFNRALVNLKSRGISVIVHVILGLPGETSEDIYQTIDYIAAGISVPAKNIPNLEQLMPSHEKKYSALENNITVRADGIKLQLLHVLKNTDLALEYEKEKVPLLTLDEYLPLLAGCVRRLPPDMVIHRLTGDGPKKLLIAPLWTGNKRMVLNTLQKYFKENQVTQGSLYTEQQSHKITPADQT